MKSPHRAPLFLVLASLLFPFGCSAQTSSMLPGTMVLASHPTFVRLSRRGWVLPQAAEQKLLYVSDDIGVEIYKFGKQLKQVGELTDQLDASGRLWVDKNRNVYVVNDPAFADCEVVEFPPGKTSASTIYQPCGPSGCNSFPQLEAESVAVDAGGVVYVGTTAGIYEFEQGNPFAFRVLTDDTSAFGLALDSSGNLYATYTDDVMKYVPGAISGTPLRLRGLDSAANLAVAQNDDIVVGESVVEEQTFELFYKPGQRNAFRILNALPTGVGQIVFDMQGTLYATNAVRYRIGRVVVNRAGQRQWSRLLRSRSLLPGGVAISPPETL